MGPNVPLVGRTYWELHIYTQKQLSIIGLHHKCFKVNLEYIQDQHHLQ